MPHTFVIFGASGDLTSRKLVPALYQLFRKKRLPADTRIVGFSRTEFTHDAWRAELAESTAKFAGNDFDAGAVGRVRRTDFLPRRATSAKPTTSRRLAKLARRARKAGQPARASTTWPPPRSSTSRPIEQLGRAGLADETAARAA